MKEFRLSTAKERFFGLFFSVLSIACMGILLYALRGDLLILCMTAAGVLLVTAGLVIYMIGVVQARCIPDPEHKKLCVKGIRERTLDLSTAVLLETIPVKSGHSTSRTLYFSDAEGKVVAAVPTYFTSKQGILADPMAKELAEVLGLEFRANVPEWYYDKQKRIEHDKEEAQREKEEAKARREAKIKVRREKLLKKYQDKQ